MHASLPWLGAIVLGGALGVAQAAGDPAKGRDKAGNCLGCHGIPSYTNVYPTYRVPRLGGQHPEYIVAALKAYQRGDRPHPTMRAQAASLSEQDMADLAAFFSRFKEVTK